MKPRIGITSALGNAAWQPGGSSYRPYADAVEAAGGLPVHLDGKTQGREPAVLQELDGLLLTGGKDVHLRSYPNPPEIGTEDVDDYMRRHRMRPEPLRDAYEIPLVQHALEHDLPVLGICRGCQVLNVALGGRLILDIGLEWRSDLQHTTHPGPDGASAFHPVRVEDDSHLARVFRVRDSLVCNSRHHQAVRADSTFRARVTAVAEDGLIEAIEVPGRRWAVGVQWHPEHANDHHIRREHAPLFRAFVHAAART